MAGTGGKGVIGNLPSSSGGGGGSVTPGSGSSGFTPGSVIIADGSGKLNQDNANWFVDDGAEKEFMFGTNIQRYGWGIHARVTNANNPELILFGQGTGGNYAALFYDHGNGSNTRVIDWAANANDAGDDLFSYTLAEGTNNTYKIEAHQGTSGELLLNQSGGNVGIGVAPGATAAKLDVNGTVNIGDVLTLTKGFTVGAGANQLPGSPVVGMVARVTDALAPVIGSAVAGSGAAAALCWYNGSQWTVIGI